MIIAVGCCCTAAHFLLSLLERVVEAASITNRQIHSINAPQIIVNPLQ
jgi:hypothetical protein